MKITPVFSVKSGLCSIFFALIFLSEPLKAQRHEVGIMLGMANLVGDVGRTNYILQKPVLSNISDYGVPFYGGILYRMNFNPYQTLRFNLGIGNVQFIDALAKEQYRRNRKLWGTNTFIEAEALFEYNFFPVNEEQRSLVSPYIFGGIGGLLVNSNKVILENDFKRDASGVPQAPKNASDFRTTPTYENGQNVTVAIPFGVGLKYKLNYNWALSGEFKFRPTFSDAIDYSVIDEKNVKVTYNKDITAPGLNTSLLQESPYKETAEARAAEFLKNRQIGNVNSKDWINTVSIALTYSFGRPPCYCGE